MNYKNIILFFVFLFLTSYAHAQKFHYAYIKGEKYRIIYEVDEVIKINGAFSHRSNILNKVAVNTLSVKDGAGELSCNFQTSESFFGSNTSFELKQDYYSKFWRDKLGVFIIDDTYYMPVIRNVPRFPDRDVVVGESWTAAGYEVHDLRRQYKITEALRFPVKVHYKYLKNENLDSKKIAIIKVSYTVFHKTKYQQKGAFPVPVLITGSSQQIYYWNIVEGRLHSRTEEFDYIFQLSNKTTIEYVGSSKGTYLVSPRLEKIRIAKELDEELKKQGIKDTTVKTEERGVTLTLKNIQFKPYSAQLFESEKNKLKKISEFLKKFPSRDFMITGHTARVGPERTSQILSEKRAKSVSDYLIQLKTLKNPQVITVGHGSRKPLADNKTEEGKKKNRRVEITILEN